MTDPNLRSGKVEVSINDEKYDIYGDWTCGLGTPKRDALIGADTVHGYSETQQVAFIEGSIRRRPGLSLKTLFKITGATITLEEAVGTTMLTDAWYAGDASFATEAGGATVRFESAIEGEEI